MSSFADSDKDTGEKFTINSYMVDEDFIVPDAFELVHKDRVLLVKGVLSIDEKTKALEQTPMTSARKLAI